MNTMEMLQKQLGVNVVKSLSSELWKPEIGEARAFRLDRLQVQQGDKDSFIVIHGIDMVNGDQFCFVGGKILENRLAENHIQNGDHLIVEYKGKIKTKKGDDANDWAAFTVDAPDFDPDKATPSKTNTDEDPSTETETKKTTKRRKVVSNK